MNRVNRVNNNETAELDDGMLPPYGSFDTVVTTNEYHRYISSEIGLPIDYIGLIHTIRMAQEGDVVYLYLNTPGGDLQTGIQLISAMQSSDAHIITIAEGEVASMGAIIFLSGDECIIKDNTLFMLHNYSGGVAGTGNDQLVELTSTIKWYNKLVQSTCYPFLSQDEIDDIVIKGANVWFDTDEVNKRLDRVGKIREKEYKARDRILTQKLKKANAILNS